jgi:hypothetical protein
MKKYLSIFFLFLSHVAFCEKGDTTFVHQRCLQIASMGDSILRGSSDSIRILNNENLLIAIDSLLRIPESFSYSFSSLKNLSVLKSDDDRFRVYTWMLPTQRGMKYNFYGFVQLYNEEKNTVKVFRLQQKDYPSNDAAELLKLTDSTWYGALYYKIIYKRYDKKDQYILLGWQGKDIYTTRKVIDNISVTTSKVEFGKPVFKPGGKARGRIILEYNARANVSLNYNEDERMIIYDHLSSSDPRPESKGVYALYGPDLTYDGYKFKDGFWLLQKDVQVRNEYNAEPKDIKVIKDKDLLPHK